MVFITENTFLTTANGFMTQNVILTTINGSH